jgi:hypothetical protein
LAPQPTSCLVYWLFFSDATHTSSYRSPNSTHAHLRDAPPSSYRLHTRTTRTFAHISKRIHRILGDAQAPPLPHTNSPEINVTLFYLLFLSNTIHLSSPFSHGFPPHEIKREVSRCSRIWWSPTLYLRVYNRYFQPHLAFLAAIPTSLCTAFCAFQPAARTLGHPEPSPLPRRAHRPSRPPKKFA